MLEQAATSRRTVNVPCNGRGSSKSLCTTPMFASFVSCFVVVLRNLRGVTPENRKRPKQALETPCWFSPHPLFCPNCQCPAVALQLLPPPQTCVFRILNVVQFACHALRNDFCFRVTAKLCQTFSVAVKKGGMFAWTFSCREAAFVLNSSRPHPLLCLFKSHSAYVLGCTKPTISWHPRKRRENVFSQPTYCTAVATRFA